ncbi:PhoH family protein [Desulfovibrio subterraneus]|uniref:Phosphate starvation protein PhoH n=1 Tax=Desulfovibrio subterraneus TaxID=2718620 RepID=A0A7J0BKS2_9BACT|nr:PhoH family protein [Desulfovibrio subterraneus]GFM34363.1 phosphate starvation protein PhoH [Desulfovibrio subterraneus]
MGRKNFVLDTNVLIENPDCIHNLRNGEENNIFIPYHVLIELNSLKTNPRLRHIVSRVVDTLLANKEIIQFIRNDSSISRFTEEVVDNFILREINAAHIDSPILVTNDKILRLQAGLSGIDSEELRDSRPFESDSQRYTGFLEAAEPRVDNSFTWHEGKPMFHGAEGDELITYQMNVWNVKPRNVYQNLALMLMQRDGIDLVSIQSEAGYGKTYLALASALYLALERKQYEKIYVVKPLIELGTKMGYLPGDVREKMEPYVKYIQDLLVKLHISRPANRIFANPGEEMLRYNPKRFEILPLAYIRGMNIENAIVIVDETQNLSRNEMRALLTRMGENVKCFCLGDTRQVDNPYLNDSNNGLNWIVRKLKGFSGYAHMVLKGDRSRGPITDMVLRAKL